MMKNKNSISNSMWCLRAVAIVSVVCAHCNVENNFSHGMIAWEAHILSNIGTIGVGLFFFSSGYFYKKYNINQLRRKFFAEIIPWWLAASVVWLYVVLRKGGIDTASWIKFVLGYNSIYYFMVDLLIVKTIFAIIDRVIKNPFVIHIICMLLNVVSIWMISTGNDIAPTPYLNPLIFISYFSLGHLFSSYQWKLEKQYILFAVVGMAVILFSKISLAYYMGIEEVFIETLFICTIWTLLCKQKNVCSRMIDLGKNSYAVYLWHIPVAGIVSNLCNKNIILQYLSLLWPIIIIIITLTSLYSCRKCFKLLKIEDYFFITGVRS